jgi:hypothetical protein
MGMRLRVGWAFGQRGGISSAWKMEPIFWKTVRLVMDSIEGSIAYLCGDAMRPIDGLKRVEAAVASTVGRTTALRHLKALIVCNERQLEPLESPKAEA